MLVQVLYVDLIFTHLLKTIRIIESFRPSQCQISLMIHLHYARQFALYQTHLSLW